MIACPGCGFEAPDDFTFCPQCAAKLVAATAAVEERKTVTTLFCDLVSFTAMSEAADPEDVDRILGEYFARATRVIESHGGTVEKFIGDAVVGVFGVPATHEDDPERAVRAGLRLLEALEGMTRPDGSPLEARCGVNTGEALVRLDVDPASGRGFLTGDAVNTAARLQAAAPPGGVAVGGLTHQLSERVIVYEKLPPVAAKGKSDLVLAWRAIAPVARRGLEPDPADLTPLVGREVELTHLKNLADKAIAFSSPQFALVIGEPGIGKSRLVRELFAYVDSAPQLITWRQGRCLSWGEDVAFWALAEIVKAQAGILETDDAAIAETKLDAVVPDGPDRAWLANRLRALIGLDAPQAEREENFKGWIRFVEQLACDGPLVVVLEDLHWADDGLLAFVEYVVAHIEAVPLLLIGTARPELFEEHAAFAAGSDQVNRVVLGPLAPQETQRLVAGLLGDAALLGRKATDIVERSKGNPFFAEESARLLSDHQGDAPVPASVQGVVAARLDSLPADEKAVLADAAVVGEVFWDGAVAALDHGDVEAVDSRLHALGGKRLVRLRRESSMAGESEFEFAHVLAREVAYGALPRRVRAAKHAQAADWLRGKAGKRLEDVSEVLTYHQVTAFELARALGDRELVDRLRAPSVEALRIAGERTMRLDVEAAERLLAKAVDLSSRGDPLRADLLQAWGRSLLQRDRYAEAKVALEESVRGFLGQGRRGDAAITMTWLEKAVYFLLGGDEWRTVLESALDLTADEPDSAARAIALTAMASAVVFRADYAAGLEWARRAVDVYVRRGEPVPLDLQGWQAQAECGLGDRGAGDRLLGVTRAMRDEGMGREAAVAYVNAGVLLYPFEGPSAYESAEEGLEFTRSRGISTGQGTLALNRCAGLAAAGYWDEALSSLDSLGDWLVKVDNQFMLAFWCQSRAALLASMGRGEEALESAQEAEERAAAWDNPVLSEGALIGLVLALASTGDRPGALGLLRRLSAAPRLPGYMGNEEEIPELMRWALKYEEPAIAEQLLAGVQPCMPLMEHVLATGRALLAEWEGERLSAAVGFEDAAVRWRDFGVPYEEAQALLGQGRCLVALGRAQEAATPLVAARDIFTRLGAKPALTEVGLLLSESTTTRR